MLRLLINLKDVKIGRLGETEVAVRKQGRFHGEETKAFAMLRDDLGRESNLGRKVLKETKMDLKKSSRG